MKRLLLSALLVGLVAACSTVPQEEKSAAVPEKKVAKAVKRPAVEPARHHALEKLSGPAEDLSCFTGVQDRHARIGVHVVGKKVDYFAFYSKRKPRTCSIDVARENPNGLWEENGTRTKITLAEHGGVLLISRTSQSYRFDFQNVDRMKFCGMDGKINGSLIVTRGQSKCLVSGIMNGH